MKVIFMYSKHCFSDFLITFFFFILLLFSLWPTDGLDRITKQFPLTGGTIPAHPTCLLATELAEQLSPVPLPGNADSNSYIISAANWLYSKFWWRMNCISATQICPDLRKKSSSFGMLAVLRQIQHHRVSFKCVGHALSVVNWLGTITEINHTVFSGKAEWKRVWETPAPFSWHRVLCYDSSQPRWSQQTEQCACMLKIGWFSCLPTRTNESW